MNNKLKPTLCRMKIVEILHSGRKGIRGTPVTDSKYDSLINCTVSFQKDNLRLLKPISFTLIDNPLYEFWYTSPVISLGRNKDCKLIIETVNTIYILSEIN